MNYSRYEINPNNIEGSNYQNELMEKGGQFGKKIAKKGLKKGAKLAGKAIKKVLSLFVKVVIKGLILLFAKLGIVVGVILLVLLILATAYTFEYKGVFRNFDDNYENTIISVNNSDMNNLNSNEIPPEYIPIYKEAASTYDVDWWILAAIHKTETSFSKNVKVSSAGAIGHMQFMPSTWYGRNNRNQDPKIIKKSSGFGVDGDGDNKADPWNVKDAIFSAANYLNHDHYRVAPLDALSLYGASEEYSIRVMNIGKSYAGLNPNNADLSIDNNELALSNMSPENKEIYKRIIKSSQNSINKVIDKFEQEENYRTTWGVLAALDTLKQMKNNDLKVDPEYWGDKLKPVFEYSEGKRTIYQTTKIYNKNDKGEWVLSLTKNITPKNVTYQLLNKAITFAGTFEHSYKKSTINDEKTYYDDNKMSIVETKIIQDIPSNTIVNPDFTRLISVIDSMGLDGNEFPLVLELADTYETGQFNESDLGDDSFWTIAYDQVDTSNNNIGPNSKNNPSLPGSVGSGKLGEFNFWPISASNRISSPFGWRIHPVLHTRKFHTGVDISGPNGSYQIKGKPIIAADQGKVIYSGIKGNYGYAVMIDHGDGISTLYAHMRDVPIVKMGDNVEGGQTLGYVGKTGRSTAEHLHFEVRVNGNPKNPLDYKFSSNGPINLDVYQK